jgi:SAM-dependent methyltransferase
MFTERALKRTECMSRKAIEQAVESFRWYQRIRLGEDLYTPAPKADTGTKLEMMQLPEDLSGKSVLDIGCNEGFFAFEAERRGASSVLAVDTSKTAVPKFELVKRILNSKVQFAALNVYDLHATNVGTFDLVFFLAVFHHLRYPFLALDKIASVTKGLAIMEIPIAVAVSSNVPDPGLPVMIRRIGKRGTLRLLPNVPFLIEILHRAGFGRVDILGSHRRRSIHGYESMYVQERQMLKADRVVES